MRLKVAYRIDKDFRANHLWPVGYLDQHVVHRLVVVTTVAAGRLHAGGIASWRNISRRRRWTWIQSRENSECWWYR